MQTTQDFWKKCSTCKRPIGFQKLYWICNVTTCNKQRTGLVFCSVGCFDGHLPIMRHREAWALEKTAPTKEQASQADFNPNKIERPPSQEVLVVTSKMKEYIRFRWGMNTSTSVVDIISDKIREWTKAAIANAEKEGRKTILDRDIH